MVRWDETGFTTGTMRWPLKAVSLPELPPPTTNKADHSILSFTHPSAIAIDLVLGKLNDLRLLADVDCHCEALDEEKNLHCQEADLAKTWTDWHVKSAAIKQ